MDAQHPDRKRLLIPRPRAQAQRFAAEVAAAAPGRWAITCAPLMEIRLRPGPVPLDGVTGLIFTSGNGVTAFCAASTRRDLPVLCVGARTTRAARAAGFAATQAGDSAAELAAHVPAETGGRWLHVRGAHAAGDLAGELRAAGHRAAEVALYEQAALDLPAPVLADLAAGAFAAVTLFSPRSADLFGRAVRPAGLSPRTALLCLSPAIAAQAMQYHRGPVLAAGTIDSAGMLSLLEEAASQ